MTSKWLITMAGKPPTWGCSPSEWPKWLRNVGDPSYLLSDVMIQVPPARTLS